MLVQNYNLFLFEMHKPARRAVKSSSPLAPHKSKSTATLGPMCLKPWPDFSRSNSVRHWGGDCKLDWSTFAASGGWTGLKRKQMNHCEKLKSRQSRWTVLDHLHVTPTAAAQPSHEADSARFCWELCCYRVTCSSALCTFLMWNLDPSTVTINIIQPR